MKRKYVVVFTLLMMVGGVFASEGWETDYKKASAKAKSEGKYLLLDFSGSDWCIWCIRLDKEVFSKNEFKDYAKENLVLVLLDFPQGKELPENVKKQNDELARKFNVSGFPTVILLDPSGKPVAKTGYQDGGPVKYVEHIKTLIEKYKNKISNS